MKEKKYIQQLENRLHELACMLTDHNLYSFLSDLERKKLNIILRKTSEAKMRYKTA